MDTRDNPLLPNKSFKRIVAILLGIIFVVGALSYIALLVVGNRLKVKLPFSKPGKPETKIIVEKFSNEQDFKSYLAEVELSSQITLHSLDSVSPGAAFGEIGSPAFKKDLAPERVSETNIQVKGIDEPDIVKTDGKSIFFSTSTFYYQRGIPVPLMETIPDSIFPPQPIGGTKVVKAFPPTTLTKDSEINRTGNLLLNTKKLIIFSDQTIYGYDVSDPSSPKESWAFTLDSRSTVTASRLFDGKIYLVLQQSINDSNPCPISLGKVTSTITIACNDIYRPNIPVPVDSTFSIVVLNPENGGVNEKTSFVGSSSATITYMSPNSLYITYTYLESTVTFFRNFLNEKGKDLISNDVLSRLRELQGYNISEFSKMTEMQLILERYYSSLSTDERRRVENEIGNRMEDYSKEHARELQKTAIVKLKNSNLSISSVGEVPGTPLNQFSLDEYKDNLRIATTTTGAFFSSGDSVNDIYVLSENLSIIGSIKDLGLTERIYSARFVEDKGYLVTFRQIDPFYVLDLTDPRNPKKSGELKIPGFSSYLHPITKDKILGVGREDAQVKISLFDVSNPSNPKEVAKYNLDEFWSEIETTHHAFLLDDKHQVFFLPAGASSYIFSYSGNELKLQRVVSDISAQRAVYIDNYMYVIGDTKIVVLNESDWTEVNSLTF